MKSKRDALLVALVVTCAAAAVFLAIYVNLDAPAEEEPTADEAGEEDEALDDILYGETSPEPSRPRERADEPDDLSPRAEGDPEQREWRRRGGDRDASPEEREERRQRRIDRLVKRMRIEPLGASPPTIDPEEVATRITDELRPAMRQCVQEAGGFRAMRAAFGDAGRTRPRVSFEVGPNGTISADSIRMEPAPPGGIGDCVRSALAAIELDPPGGDGARIEMPLGGRRRGFDGDGGGGPWEKGRWFDRSERREPEPPAP